MIYWFRQQQLTVQLEKQQIETELKFLKSQIQPHFLFNVLNNIYSLAIQKSEQTPEVVIRLSEFLRYILYEAGDKKIPLSKEIDYLQNYIELQRIRFGNRANITWQISGEPGNLQIEPMLLITFLENSFKHGVSSQLQEVWVKIGMQISGNELTFEVRNSKPAEEKREKKEPGGIGLENVQRRLQLLYPDNFELSVNELHNEYHVNLKIIL
jgi:LytS/YehU family sensor histidine kinase